MNLFIRVFVALIFIFFSYLQHNDSEGMLIWTLTYALTAVFILTLIPTIDEGLQYVFDIPGRVPEFYDFIVDIVGGYCGALCLLFIHKVKNKNG